MFSQLLLKCHECLTCLAESPCRVSWNKKPEQGWLCRDLHSQPGRNTPNIPLPRELLGFFGSDLPIKRRLSLCPLRCHVTAFSSCCLLFYFFYYYYLFKCYLFSQAGSSPPPPPSAFGCFCRDSRTQHELRGCAQRVPAATFGRADWRRRRVTR